MLKNILEYLEKTLSWLPEKAAFRDDREALTFRQIQEQANALGSFLLARNLRRTNIALCMERSPAMIAAFLGIVSGGSCCIPLEEDMPLLQMEQILRLSRPAAIVCDDAAFQKLSGSGWACRCIPCRDAFAACPNPAALAAMRCSQVDTDPVLISFVSGPDGVPLGIPLTHRNLLNAAENISEVLKCSCASVFGSQSTLPFSDCLKEILCTLKFGSSCILLPRECFSYPVRLVEALNRNEINTVCWSASALTAISSRNTFLTMRPEHLHTVAFSNDPFSTRQLLLWQKVLPGARFLHLYGPVETAGACCWYEVKRRLSVSESVPLGQPFPNTGILLLDEQGQEAPSGEICIRGSCLAMGYYRSSKNTASAFLPDPAYPGCPARIFRTGDYGRYNDRGELVLLGRRDSRITFRGRRIELGDIEAAALSHADIDSACCQFEEKDGRIQLFYTGRLSCQALAEYLQDRLPRYMLPGAMYFLEFMPLTPAGKIDRSLLRSNSRKGLYAYETANISGRPGA